MVTGTKAPWVELTKEAHGFPPGAPECRRRFPRVPLPPKSSGPGHGRDADRSARNWWVTAAVG
jgi:hypothetical protein